MAAAGLRTAAAARRLPRRRRLMAKRLDFEVPREERRPGADAELALLLQALHERGVLRLLRDFVGALPHIGMIVARGLNSAGTINCVRNLSLLLETLAQIPPTDLSRVLNAVRAGCIRMGE